MEYYYNTLKIDITKIPQNVYWKNIALLLYKYQVMLHLHLHLNLYSTNK